MKPIFHWTVRHVLVMLLILLMVLPLIAAGAQLAPVQASPQGQIPWPMFGFDPQHSHFNPYEHVLSPTNVSKLTLDWTANVGVGGHEICATPVVADGLLFLNDGSGYLDAFDTRTGTLTWQYPLDSGTDGCSSPTVVKGVLYIGTGDSFTAPLLALDARTGTLLWSYSNNQVVYYSTPTVVNGVVYIQDDGGELYAINAQTGTLLWSGLQGAPGDIQLGTAPAVANGVVYAAMSFTFSSMIQLDAYNAQTGTRLWQSVGLMPINQNGATTFYGAPVVANGLVTATAGLVYISADPSNVPGAGVFDAVNAQTGVVVWSANLHLSPDQYPPVAAVAVAHGVLYIGSGDGWLSALDARTGHLLWHFAATSSTDLALTPTVANGVVYTSTEGWARDNILWALDAQSGQLLWSTKVGAYSGISSPIVVNGTLYAYAPWNAKLYAFHLPGKSTGP